MDQSYLIRKAIDCHHFELITWPAQILRTRMCVFVRLVCNTLKMRPTKNFVFLFFVKMRLWCIISVVFRVFLGIPNSAGGFRADVTPPGAPRIQCSKMVKLPIKCMLDNLKVIVVLRLKINLTSCFNTKSSLIWSFKLSRTVTKLFKQCD